MTFSIKRIISLFISAALIFSALSAFAVNSFAATLNVSSDEELRTALESTTPNNITLTSDITVILSEYKEYHYTVKAKHTLDLNGYSITVTNESNLNGTCDDSTLFYLPIGGNLTVDDTSDAKTGSVSYLGGIHAFSESVSYKPLEKITSRNLFFIDEGATVKILAGQYTAGNSEDQWVHRALEVKNGSFDYYTGKCTNVVYGTVFTVSKNSSLTINSGTFVANGSSRENTLPNRKGWDEKKPTSVCVRSFDHSKVTINDGKFIGANGADVFDFNAASTVHVLAGSFNNTPATHERISDYDGFAAIVSSEHYGRVNLPIGAVYAENRTKFVQNGEFLPELPGNSFLRESNGSEIVLSPSEGHPTWIKAVNFKSSYAPGSKGSLDSNYDPYFTEGSVITYKWYYSDANGNMKEIPSSNSKILDLSKMSSKGCTLSVGSFYSFRCIITEKYEGNNSYVITTISHNYDLSTSNKYILAGVSLTPSGIDSSDRYKPGNIPSFSVPSGSNYTVSNVTAYPVNSSDAVTTLAQNSTYFITIKVSAKGSYVFTQDSRISYLPGFTSQKMTASSDGKSAIITGYIDTYCSHSSTKTFFNEAQHSKICNTCGTVTEVKVHSYSDWVLVGSDYERTCSACTHKQTVPSIVQADDIATTVHSLVFDLGAQTVSKAPVAPTLVALPGFENLSIVSFSWKDQDGVDVTLFEAEKTYVLTVELTINEESDALFSQNNVNVFSLTGTNGQGVVSDDCKQVTVTFNVTPYTSKSSSITLPSVKEGVSIIGSKPALTLNDYCVIWKMNGVAIGSFDVINGEVSSVTDLNTEDGVDFSEQTFVEGNLYEIEILWNEDGKNVILDANNLTLVSNYAPYHSIVAGVRGIATGGFYIPKADKIIRSPGVTGIVAPVLGKTPSTSKTSLKAIGSGFSITSVSWSKSGSSVKTFACGGAYTVKVTLTASEGYTFDLVDGSINGLQSSVSVSGSTLVLTYTFAKLNHNVEFGKASVTLPNCNEGGSVVAKCSNCSVTSSISVQALGHTFNTVNAVSPTCSSNGVSQHEVCYYCLTALSENENGLILPKDPEAHSSSTVTVHDGNYHYDICLDCGTELSEKAEHSYGEYITLEDGYTYHECECGHSVSKDGPKAPSVPVGDDEVIIDNGKNKSEGFGDLPIEKIKTLLLIMLIFAILLLGSIIAISIILIVTREKPVVATEIAVEGSNDISDKKTEQENTTVNK